MSYLVPNSTGRARARRPEFPRSEHMAKFSSQAGPYSIWPYFSRKLRGTRSVYSIQSGTISPSAAWEPSGTHARLSYAQFALKINSYSYLQLKLRKKDDFLVILMYFLLIFIKKYGKIYSGVSFFACCACKNILFNCGPSCILYTIAGST